MRTPEEGLGVAVRIIGLNLGEAESPGWIGIFYFFTFLLFFLFRRLSCPTFSLAFSTVGRSGGVLLVYFVIGPLFLLCLGRVGLADMNVLGVDR